MEHVLSTREEISLQSSGLIEQALCKIYGAHSHEIKTILFAADSLISVYGEYNEYELIKKTVDEEEE